MKFTDPELKTLIRALEISKAVESVRDRVDGVRQEIGIRDCPWYQQHDLQQRLAKALERRARP